MSFKRSRAAFEAGDRCSRTEGPPTHAPYAIYGTPLPAYDAEARDDGSYVPLWKQEVKDEHGRKRLHGAFTGGWSAGYFNTVGSKEGFTPSTFVSSKTNRAKNKAVAQRVEDFMDEEDLADLAESQRLEVQGGFAGIGGNDQTSRVPKGMFNDLFRATGETMGMKLLQRMGWKQGQGIGAKVRRRARGDQTGSLHLFAPNNSRMVEFDRKTNRNGLGFATQETLGDIGSHNSKGRDQVDDDDDDNDDSDRDARILRAQRSKLVSKPKKQVKTGFGVGVLNDDGSDDDDPYAIGPQIRYNRIIGTERKKKKGLGQSNSTPIVAKSGVRPKLTSERSNVLSGFRKCHDGRLPLEGFVLSSTPLLLVIDNRFAPPAVPEGWKPARSTQILSENKPSFQSTADAAKSSTLDAKARAALLGEQQLPGKSVFDFITPQAREKIAAASGKTNLPPALGESAPAGFKSNEATKRDRLWDLVPDLDRETASAVLQRSNDGWMPYGEDPGKRARYRYFLELRAGLATNLPDRPPEFSVDEWAKELNEFAQAAAIFKPMSGLMASRFTSSSSAPRLASDSNNAVPVADTVKEQDPADKAAKMGMYGPMTRSQQTFFPTRLLCKRFGIRPPENVSVDPGDGPDGDESGLPSKNTRNNRLALVSQTNLDRMMSEANFKPRPTFVSGGVQGETDATSAAPRVAPETVDVETNTALEGPKAGEAVFKAIFGSDSEDGDER